MPVMPCCCEVNEDPCLEGCCALLAIMIASPPEGATLPVFTDGRFYKSAGQGIQGILTTAQCENITGDSTGWVITSFSIHVITGSGTCPPIDADNATASLWTSLTAGEVAFSVRCYDGDYTMPDTTQLLMVSNLINNVSGAFYYTSGLLTTTPDPDYNIWDGMLKFTYGGSTYHQWTANNPGVRGVAMPAFMIGATQWYLLMGSLMLQVDGDYHTAQLNCSFPLGYWLHRGGSNPFGAYFILINDAGVEVDGPIVVQIGPA